MVFGLDDPNDLAGMIAARLGTRVAAHELRDFADGEFKVRPLTDPRGAHACVVAGLSGDARRSPQDRLCMLLFFIAALRDHGASRISVIAPYLPFARKDRRTRAFDPISLRYVAQLLEAAAPDELLTIEVHNPAAFDNAFRFPARSLATHEVLLSAALEQAGSGPLAIASPDPGGIRRAQSWREAVEHATGHAVGFAMLDKRRHADHVSGSETVCGDVRGMTVLLIDDMVGSGTTMARAARALLCAGALRVIGVAGHGLFLERAADLLEAAGLDGLILCDSLPQTRLTAQRFRSRVRWVSTADHLATALVRAAAPDAHAPPRALQPSQAACAQAR